MKPPRQNGGVVHKEKVFVPLLSKGRLKLAQRLDVVLLARRYGSFVSEPGTGHCGDRTESHAEMPDLNN